MNLRDKLKANPAIGYAIVGVLLLIAIINTVAFLTRSPSQALQAPYVINRLWYLDLQSGERFTLEGEVYPPVTAPSGGEGVRAYIYSCSRCEDEASQFIGYLEKSTPAMKAAIESGEAMRIDEVVKSGESRLVSKAEPVEWIAANSSPGIALQNSPAERCEAEGKPLQACYPPQ